MGKRGKVDALDSTSLGEQAAIGRIQKALFGGDDRLVNLGRYEIGALIGSGAFGKVYRARDPQLDREIALKVLTADGIALDDDDRAALLREARTMAALGHPNVVAVHDAGVVDHAGRVRVFIAMELVAGTNLRHWLERPHTPAAILGVLVQAGRGLAAAHAAGIVHRDLKPDNILVGDDGRARVVDFGLARPHAQAAGAAVAGTPAAATVTRAIAGTPAYMAPELLDGAAAGPRTDQFAFCVTAWEALSGERPFHGESVAELRDRMTRPPAAPPRWFAPRIQRALLRGLAPDPAGRFASIDELLAALEPRRARWIIPVALVATAGAGLAIGLVATRAGPEAAPTVDPCPAPTAELAGVWDPARRAATADAFRATQVPVQADTFARVAAQLDRASAAWLVAHRDACVATAVRHDQSAELLDRRMSCLRDWRRHLRELTTTFAAATVPVVYGAVRAIAELPALAACADRDALAAGPAPPSDPAIRARLDALFDKLARARAALITGPTGAAAAGALADQVAADGLATSHTPLALALALWRADAATAVGHLDDARTAARSAFDLAVGVADRRAAITAATALARLGAYDTRRKDDALQWVRTGRATVDKLDHALELAAELAVVEGNVHLVSADAVAAEPAFARAVDGFRKLDPNHPGVGRALAMLGASELGRGKLDDGERHLREALARSEAALGATHPDLARILVNLGLIDAGRGHYADAPRSTDRAIEITRRAYGDDNPALVYAYGSRAQHAQMRGDHAAADRDYREAARIAEASFGADHPMLAQISLIRADLAARDGRATEAVGLAKRGRDFVAKTADDRDLGLAYADATLARAIAATGARDRAIVRARSAVARCDAFPAGMPSGPCAIVYQALGDLARDPRERDRALDAAARAITTGTPDPVRLAEVRFALARLRHDGARGRAVELARLAEREFPRDGDPALRAALVRWLAAPR